MGSRQFDVGCLFRNVLSTCHCDVRDTAIFLTSIVAFCSRPFDVGFLIRLGMWDFFSSLYQDCVFYFFCMHWKYWKQKVFSPSSFWVWAGILSPERRWCHDIVVQKYVCESYVLHRNCVWVFTQYSNSGFMHVVLWETLMQEVFSCFLTEFVSMWFVPCIHTSNRNQHITDKTIFVVLCKHMSMHLGIFSNAIHCCKLWFLCHHWIRMAYQILTFGGTCSYFRIGKKTWETLQCVFAGIDRGEDIDSSIYCNFCGSKLLEWQIFRVHLFLERCVAREVLPLCVAWEVLP